MLATEIPTIDKVIFVVDRKDLDYQTMKEYDRFEKGAANGNSSTRILQRQLENKNEAGNYEEYKIIVTTIQKLDVFIKKNRTHDIYRQHVVLIFDECHRSQLGEMHRAIIKNFRNYHIFVFTGTPIFAANAPLGGNPAFSATEQVFGEKLHTYTIMDAINDGNVLPFRIDFVDTIKMPDYIEDEEVYAIDRERALAGRSGYRRHSGRREPGCRESGSVVERLFGIRYKRLQRTLRHQFRHLFGQVSKLLQGFVTEGQEQGSRPPARREHVPYRVRCDDRLLAERDLQDYQSIYLDLYHDFKAMQDSDKENINDDINSSMELRSKKDLIERFIKQVSVSIDVDEDWKVFLGENKEKDLEQLIEEENLKREETVRFVEIAFRDGIMRTTGTDIDRIMPPVSRFASNRRAIKKQTIIEKLLAFFEKYFGLI